MCGIVGYVGPDDALPIVLDGLARLEYRGYDSAGIAVADGALTVVRRAGRVADLDAALGAERPSAHAGMGHTRWATHGAPTDRNAHPHVDCTGRIAVIHNGIVENHAALRADLERAGHRFASETDTEVIAHLLEATEGAIADRVRTVARSLEGAYALVVLSADEPDVLVGVRISSPLVVGLGSGENLLASDIAVLLERTRRVVPLAEGTVAEVRADGVRLTDLAGAPLDAAPTEVTWDVARAQKGGYDHFMRKEIDEQPAAVRDTLAGRVEGGALVLDAMAVDPAALRDLRSVSVVACGTAYHAGLVGKYAIEPRTRVPVEIDIASEFRYRDPVLGPDTLTIAVSQSGETIDTLEAARHAREQGSRVLAVTNTVGSSLAREADAVLYTHAGPEVSVASTKTFATQMVALHLVSLYLAQARGSMEPSAVRAALDDLAALPVAVERAIALEPAVRAVAASLRDARGVLFLGRHVGYPSALEGALKLKEVSYLHAEGYPAGELKHGPIALVEPGLPVVVVATSSPVLGKVVSNVQEVRARGARVIAVVTEGEGRLDDLVDDLLEVPAVPDLLAPVVVAPPLQLLAYHAALARGCDVDRPRNLAKSVTVE